MELNQLKACTKLEFNNSQQQPPYGFVMTNFSKEKAKDKLYDWKSPPMYTHLGGYKFCIGIAANGGCRDTHGNSVRVELWRMSGEYDSQLKWPARVEFTIELINHFHGGENKRVVSTMTWDGPTQLGLSLFLFTSDPQCFGRFIRHSELPANHQQKTEFLVNDSLHFKITKIDVLN